MSLTSRNQLWLVNFSNNCRGSISDCHGFINSLPRQQQLSHLFKWLQFSFLGLFSSSCRTTCRLLIYVCFSTGFHESYTLPTTLGIYRLNCHGLTTLNLGGSGHKFGTLSFGGFTTSSVHYITRALTKALGVLNFQRSQWLYPKKAISSPP
jgi:hypothetical protein